MEGGSLCSKPSAMEPLLLGIKGRVFCCSDVDSDEFFDADNELEERPWPANQIADPPSMSIPVDDEDPEDIEEDPGLKETDDTSGRSVKSIILMQGFPNH